MSEDSGHRITISSGLAEHHRAAAADGYWQAFSRKLRYPLGPRDKAVLFLARVIDPRHAISAVSETGDFLGAAGFKTPEGAFAAGGLPDMLAAYGRIGGLWRGLLISLLERKCEDDTLLMDGIFVMPAARGGGIGTGLLDAVEAEAISRGLHLLRLDVIDTNPRARALYERRGFIELESTKLGPLAPVFGFTSVSTMVKRVGH